MKKILMFQDYFNNGGIEKVILDVKKHIDKEYKIDVLSLVNRSDKNIISLLDKDYRRFFRRTILGLKKYKKYLKTHQYDVIHIHCYNAFGLVYAKIANKYCKNIIVHAHGCSTNNDLFRIKRVINNIIRLIYKSDKYTYISVSNETNKFCFNNKKTIILPNGIDYKEYSFDNKIRKEYRNKLNVDDNVIVLGNIGRFSKQKNQSFLIDIFNEINKVKDNYRLLLVGEGVLQNKIKDKVKKMNLEDKVIFLNSRNDIPKLINMFDIYVYPSINEGFGITVIENEVNGKYTFVSDTLPKEVKISNRLEFLSLNDIKKWSSKIINMKNKTLKLDNKLDIINYINKLKDIYRGFDEENKKDI